MIKNSPVRFFARGFVTIKKSTGNAGGLFDQRSGLMEGQAAGLPFFRSAAAADANAAGRAASARVIRTVCSGTVDGHGLIWNRADH